MIAALDLEGAWGQLWPWLWPSLVFVAWTALSVWGIGRWRRWVTARFAAKTQLASPRVLRVVTRVAVIAVVAAGMYVWALVAPLSPEVKAELRKDAEPWVIATVLLVIFLALGFYGIRRAIVWLEARAAATETTIDDALIEALNRPLYVSLVLLGINLWAAIVPLPAAVQTYIGKGSETTIVVLIVLFVDGLVQGWMIARSERSKVLKTSGVVLRTSARIVLYVIGFLMALSSLGFDVTPALATLGIGSAAVGFALQGTVTDFLAGIMIAADQPVSVGDYIRLDETNQGWVLSIGWRSTRLLTRYDMHVIVPNSKLAQAVFINTSRPREECRFQPIIMIGFDEDLDAVVRHASDAADEVQKEDPRAIHAFKAFAWVEQFQHGYAEVRAWLCAKNYDAHFGLRDAYLRRVHKRLREHGVRIVNPVRTLETAPGKPVAFVPAPPPPQPPPPQPPHQQGPGPGDA